MLPIILLFFVLSQNLWATDLSGGLNADDMDKIAQTLGMGAAHHSYTAAAIPNAELGLDVGVENIFIQRQDLGGLGDSTAVLPRIIPLPRLWGTWDLPSEFRISVSLAPASFFQGISTFGGGVQWVYYRDIEYKMALSVLGEYTYVDAFGDMQAHDFVTSLQATRDLDRWQPYGGLGWGYANSSFRPGLYNPGERAAGRHLNVFHYYLGARIDMTAPLYFQLDFYNARWTGSVLISTSF